jgi:hypothetical protein
MASLRGTGYPTLTVISAIVLFSAGLVFTAEDPRLPPRLRRRFAGLRGIRAPLRIIVPGSFWGLAYSAVLTGVITGVLAWLRPDSPRDTFRWGECLATLPIYLFAFQAIGFYLSASGFTSAYTALTVAFILVISTLLPVIFQIGGRPDGIFSFYYLSPATLWTSLDPEAVAGAVEGPRYVLFGLPVIRVAQVLFGTAGITFTVLGLLACRRKGIGTWSIA